MIPPQSTPASTNFAAFFEKRIHTFNTIAYYSHNSYGNWTTKKQHIEFRYKDKSVRKTFVGSDGNVVEILHYVFSLASKESFSFSVSWEDIKCIVEEKE